MWLYNKFVTHAIVQEYDSLAHILARVVQLFVLEYAFVTHVTISVCDLLAHLPARGVQLFVTHVTNNMCMCVCVYVSCDYMIVQVRDFLDESQAAPANDPMSHELILSYDPNVVILFNVII